MAAQYAYVMKGMTKTFPGAPKPVLSNINLQFYQGAKIGIVGPNGVGKSTLMKIMAGIDTDYTGEAWPGEYITVGYLAQEPELDPTKTVLENVKDGAREVADMVERFNAISMQMGDPDAPDFDALDRVAAARRSTRSTGGPRHPAEIAMEPALSPGIRASRAVPAARSAASRPVLIRSRDPAAREPTTNSIRERRVARNPPE